MNDSRAMSKSQRLDEMGNGKRSVIVVLAVLVIGAIVGFMVRGFRGGHITLDAAAMTAPVPARMPAGATAPRPLPSPPTATP
jgi:hypothetical protein